MIEGTIILVSSVGRAPYLQAGGHSFESCIRHTFFLLSLLYLQKINLKNEIRVESLIAQ